ncbi:MULTISPECIES: hypothetical protein [Burkholderia]|uniref:glycine-rich domain-containing protein n=1 Tax=Burkholderia TaxID=32008 RepID=UPI00084189A5|nr:MULTISPECIES: hypothetical protein [unclassified Burkholderia]AOK32159.1 hypothetical protein AQ611_22150 [Burkholderia sp. Bp7605]
MANNDFLPFGAAGSANVIDQATYTALSERMFGFKSGIAQSAQLNKVWRQSSIMAAVLAQFIVDQTGRDAIDDGTTATLEANLLAGIRKAAAGRLLRTSIYIFNAGQQKVIIDGAPATTTGATSFTALPATSFVEIECQGGGGGGGGVLANGTQPAAASGGGGGSYGFGRYSSGFSNLAITIGQGGAGGAAGNNAGANGGTSSAGSLISAPGGFGGVGGAPTSPPFFNGGTQQGQAPSGHTYLPVYGGVGGIGMAMGNLNVAGGAGGASYFGPGAQPFSNSGGLGGINMGSGGGGAAISAPSALSAPGGAGQGGMVIIREYA